MSTGGGGSPGKFGPAAVFVEAMGRFGGDGIRAMPSVNDVGYAVRVGRDNLDAFPVWTKSAQ